MTKKGSKSVHLRGWKRHVDIFGLKKGLKQLTGYQNRRQIILVLIDLSINQLTDQSLQL